MITGMQRGLRRLRELHAKQNDRPVGVRFGQTEIVLSMGWDDACGRLRLVEYRCPYLYTDSARQVAEALLGRDWISGLEVKEPERCRVWYAVPTDWRRWQAQPQPTPWLEYRRPRWVRWFDWRALTAGIGQDNGVVSFGGLSLDVSQ